MAKDMRTWIKQLDDAGELQHLKKADLDELGTIFGYAREKAVLVESVTGKPGWKVLGAAPCNMRQVGIAFDADKTQVNREFAKRLGKGLIPCKTVKTGPVKEVIHKGADMKLTKLPVHVQGVKDAGPFITTGLVISKDPDTGKRNIAFHRLQVKGDNKTGILLLTERHTWVIHQKYEAMNKPMPVAIMIGHHPMYYFAAAYTGPLGLDELEVAGSLLQEPVEMVKCETVDLEVPASAEIVLEGEILPRVREKEGPFSEFQNYYAVERENPVIMYKAMTMRKDAIYKTLQHAPPNEGILYGSIPMAAALLQDIRNVGGYADIKDVSCYFGNSMFGAVVQMTPRFYGEAKHVLMAVASGVYSHQKINVAVDEDVDIYDPQDVAWAITTRVDPQDDVDIVRGVRVNGLDISGAGMDKPGITSFHRVGSKMLIDATKPPTSDPAARELFLRSRPPTPKKATRKG